MMTPLLIDEIIETAQKCGDRTTDCNKCHFRNMENCVDELNKELASKLAMAIEDLNQNCKTCFYFDIPSRQMPCAICVDRNNWKWRGADLDEK